MPIVQLCVGNETTEGGIENGIREKINYNNNYHTINDKYNEEWDFAGIIEDIIIIKDIINELANSEEKFKLIDINSLGLYLK
ncbi:hypothetical protein P4S72_25265 [Vibrio sp. PP-XX7]